VSLFTQHLDLEKFGLKKIGLEKLSLERIYWPPVPNSRSLLAYLHSGDMLRHSLPKFLRLLAVLGLFIFVLQWILTWPGIYQEFERWGLVKAFFAQVIALASVFLCFKLTLLRAGHLEALPSHDFLTLRAAAVLCRWVGECQLVYFVGVMLRGLLQPVGPTLVSMLGAISPKAAGTVSSGTPALLFLSGPLSLATIAAAGLTFILFYALATAIEVALAIEFNTRSEAVKGRLS